MSGTLEDDVLRALHHIGKIVSRLEVAEQNDRRLKRKQQKRHHKDRPFRVLTMLLQRPAGDTDQHQKKRRVDAKQKNRGGGRKRRAGERFIHDQTANREKKQEKKNKKSEPVGRRPDSSPRSLFPVYDFHKKESSHRLQLYR